MKRISYLLFFFSLLLLSCDSEKDINVPLPAYEGQPVVECYIDPGQPYRLALYESVSYFEIPVLPEIKDALVTITHLGITDTLKYQIIPDTILGKFYNYVGDTSKKVQPDYNQPYTLYIKDSKGREITATTVILPPVNIDTIEFEFNNSGRANTTTKFKDNQATRNFYRYLIIVNPAVFTEKGDILFNDALFQTSEASITSRSTVEPGIISVTLFNLNEDYYRYLQSIDDANNSNGNPFAQPAAIRSNVQGGIGIFTGLSYDRRDVMVQ